VPDLSSLLHDEVDALEELQTRVEKTLNDAKEDATKAAEKAETLDDLREMMAEMSKAIAEDMIEVWEDSYLDGVKFGKKRRTAK